VSRPEPGIRIGVVLGSVRPQRLGERVCRFVMSLAGRAPQARFTVLDLADYRLPVSEEAVAPPAGPGRAPEPEVRRWLDDMAAADGYLFLTPEHDYTLPAALKNALGHLAGEAHDKPATILSYASTAHGGSIAGNELRLTLGGLGMLPLPGSLPLAHADRLLDESGRVVGEPEWAAEVTCRLSRSLTELVRYADALRTLPVP
jgi:chromate reductase, NAD(P)H dehydrogenase (quinone)